MSAIRGASNRYGYLVLFLSFCLLSTGCIHLQQEKIHVAMPSSFGVHTRYHSLLLTALQDQCAGLLIKPGTLYPSIESTSERAELIGGSGGVYTRKFELAVHVRYEYDDGSPPFEKRFSHGHRAELPRDLASGHSGRLVAAEQCCNNLAHQIIEQLKKV